MGGQVKGGVKEGSKVILCLVLSGTSRTNVLFFFSHSLVLVVELFLFPLLLFFIRLVALCSVFWFNYTSSLAGVPTKLDDYITTTPTLRIEEDQLVDKILTQYVGLLRTIHLRKKEAFLLKESQLWRHDIYASSLPSWPFCASQPQPLPSQRLNSPRRQLPLLRKLWRLGLAP